MKLANHGRFEEHGDEEVSVPFHTPLCLCVSVVS